MKKTLLFITIFCAALLSTQAQDVWTMDKGHSKMTFTVTHLGISELDGVFKDFEAKITSSVEDFSDAVFELSADLTSVSTNNERRDAHLQRDAMFDTEKFPTLSFKSTSIVKIGDKNFELNGDLTIKGVTKPVTLALSLLGTTIHRRSKKKMAGFKVTGTVNRTDFGVGNMPAMMVAEEVELRASGEFILN